MEFDFTTPDQKTAQQQGIRWVPDEATPEQIKPPNGADKLSFLDQLMHMFVHHAQVPVSSSVIVGLIVTLSIILSKELMKVNRFNKSIEFIFFKKRTSIFFVIN